MLLLGIVAGIYNIYLYKEEILKLFAIGTNENTFSSIKSFFAHRNQYATFLYFSIISNVFLFIKTRKKCLKFILSITFIFLMANLASTASRTGILCTIAFLGLFYIFTDRLKIRYKIIIAFIVILLATFFLNYIHKNHIKLWEKGKTTIEQIFIRESSIQTFTGRSDFWVLAYNTLFVSMAPAIFGIGRFAGIAILNANNYDVTQFHNFYVEALVAGGIMELLYLLSIYVMVMVNIIRAKIDKRYKILYACLYLSYALYCGFESLGRFSIGCVDTVCMVCVITIPFLHSNSNWEKPEEPEEKIRRYRRRARKKENEDFKMLDVESE